MTINAKLKAKIQAWAYWRMQWKRETIGPNMISPNGKRIDVNTSYRILDKRFDSLVNSVLKIAREQTENPKPVKHKWQRRR